MRASRADLRNDAIAGLPGAISSVPDGMAAAILAGVSHAQGLYASFAGPTAGGRPARGMRPSDPARRERIAAKSIYFSYQLSALRYPSVVPISVLRVAAES